MRIFKALSNYLQALFSEIFIKTTQKLKRNRFLFQFFAVILHSLLSKKRETENQENSEEKGPENEPGPRMEAAFRPLLPFLQNVIVEIAIFIIFNRVARIHARKNDAHAVSEEIKSAEMDGEPNQARAKLDRGSQEKGVDEGNAVRGAIPQEKHQKENRQPNQEVDDPGHQYNFLLFAHVFSGRSISQPRIFRSVPFEGNQIQEGPVMQTSTAFHN